MINLLRNTILSTFAEQGWQIELISLRRVGPEQATQLRFPAPVVTTDAANELAFRRTPGVFGVDDLVVQ